jgi:6-phosphogluconolactonase
MMIEVYDDADLVASKAAAIIAREARLAITARGRFIVAFSGGQTPWKMLRVLASQDVPWEGVYVVQVDERLAPEGHADRNLTHLRENLLGHSPLSPGRIYAMPVEVKDLEEAVTGYAMTLERIAGSPAVIDLVHLGLGSDGHTASLVPGDPVLDIDDMDVALTGIYQGRRRMTLTYPIINRSRRILWLVTGSEKGEMLQRLLDGDNTIPAGRLANDRAMVLADSAATKNLKLI